MAPEAADLLPLTVPEVRHLLARLLWEPTRPAADVLGWSQWRRRHEARAKLCHYPRRLGRNSALYGYVRL
jgi:hypothetical protein